MVKELLQQAKLASFFDAFLTLALMCICVIPFLYILKTNKKAKKS